MRFTFKRSADTPDSPSVDTDETEAVEYVGTSNTPTARRPNRWVRVSVFAVMPAVLLAMGIGAAYLKWQNMTTRASDSARTESLQAAKDITVALLSYQAGTAEKDLEAATERMTGSFKTEYQELITKVVIPGAKEKQISATANIPAAAAVSATPERAVVLLLVNQTTNFGADQPTDMQSSVRVTMEKVSDRWLMSEFEPI